MFKVFSATRKEFVEDWSLDRNETWYVVSDDESVKGTARPVFSFHVYQDGGMPDWAREQGEYGPPKIKSLLLQLNSEEGDDLNVAQVPFLCRGKVSIPRDYRISLNALGDAEFFIETSSSGSLPSDLLDRAQALSFNNRSEVWSILFRSSFKGFSRPVFSFAVCNPSQAETVFALRQLCNDARSGKVVSISRAPFFCKGKVSSRADYKRMDEWLWGLGSS